MSINRITHKIQFEFCLGEVDDHILMVSYLLKVQEKCDSVSRLMILSRSLLTESSVATTVWRLQDQEEGINFDVDNIGALIRS